MVIIGSRVIRCASGKEVSCKEGVTGSIWSENEDDMHEDGQKVHLVTFLQIKMAGVVAIFSPPRFPDSSRYQMHIGGLMEVNHRGRGAPGGEEPRP